METIVINGTMFQVVVTTQDGTKILEDAKKEYTLLFPDFPNEPIGITILKDLLMRKSFGINWVGQLEVWMDYELILVEKAGYAYLLINVPDWGMFPERGEDFLERIVSIDGETVIAFEGEKKYTVYPYTKETKFEGNPLAFLINKDSINKI